MPVYEPARNAQVSGQPATQRELLPDEVNLVLQPCPLICQRSGDMAIDSVHRDVMLQPCPWPPVSEHFGDMVTNGGRYDGEVMVPLPAEVTVQSLPPIQSTKVFGGAQTNIIVYNPQ